MPSTPMLVFAAIYLVTLGALFAFLWWHLGKRFTPKAMAQGQRLKIMTAEMLLPLSPQQHEAVRLFAWADQIGWARVATQVLKTDDFPLTKKELLS